MARYIEDGIYQAEGVAASVYRNAAHNVVLQVEWTVPSLGKTIRSYECLIMASGEIREKAVENVRKWAEGWDGASLSWFPANITGCRAELVVENQPVNPPEYGPDGTPRTVSRVKWVNPVGGSGSSAEMAADESADLDRLFAARLRAVAGARPVAGPAAPKPAAMTPKAPVQAPPKPAPVARPAAPKPARPATPPAPPAPPPAPPQDAPQEAAEEVQPSTRDAVWGAFCAKMDEAGETDKAGRDVIWLELVRELGLTTDYASWTPTDWGRMMAKVDYENLPF